MKKIFLITLLGLVLFSGCTEESKQKTVVDDLEECEAMAGDIVCEDCGLDGRYSRDYCYQEAAKEKDNVLFCDKLDNIHGKILCYYNFAIYKQDVSLCRDIEGLECIEGSVHLLECIEGEVQLIDECYYEISKLKNDKQICKLIVTPIVKQECYK